jgi:DNA modification methylase
MDRVMKEPAETYTKRKKHPTKTHGEIIDGVRIKNKTINYLTGSTNKTKDGYELPQTKRTLPDKIRPDNVFSFSTAGAARDNTIKHPAPFHKDLPKYYINLLTDDGDTILDPFGGIMTTGLACNEIGNRNFIGFELNEKYAEFGKKRISGEELETYRVVQYDLDGNYIADYKNRLEASKATGVQDGDIMRTYNRTKFDSRGGFIWKLEKR